MAQLSGIPGIGGMGSTPGLPGFPAAFSGAAASSRCCNHGQAAGMPPMGMEGLAGLVQMQGMMTMLLLRLLMELMKGQAGGGAGSGGAGTGSSGGGASASSGPRGSAGSSEPLSGDAKKWLTGDTQGLDSGLLNALAAVGQKLGKKITVASGFRSRQEQEVLYRKYLNGTGNLAAKPGTSRHESGNAADVNVDGTPLASYPGGRAAASAAGIRFPVPGEPWHAELG